MQKAKFFLPLSSWFSTKGRISRLQYFVYGLIMIVPLALAIVGIAGSGLMVLDENDQNVTISGWLAYSVVMLGFAYLLFCLSGKRLHDLNLPAAWSLLMLFDIPVDLAAEGARLFSPLPEGVETLVMVVDGIAKFTTFGLGIMLTFTPGKNGANKYGPDPLRPPAPPVDVF